MAKSIPSAVIALAMTVAQPGAGTAQTSATATGEFIPSFRAEVWADTVTDFTVRVGAYSDLRSRLERQLPRPTMTADVGQIRRERRSLARAIRGARPDPVEGEFFTAATSAQFQLVLARIMDARMCAVIMDDNPGRFGSKIGGAYPDGKAFATTPGLVLARLPGLPDGIEFRFVGQELILYDARANTIIDRMPDAIRCPNGDWLIRLPALPSDGE